MPELVECIIILYYETLIPIYFFTLYSNDKCTFPKKPDAANAPVTGKGGERAGSPSAQNGGALWMGELTPDNTQISDTTVSFFPLISSILVFFSG